MSNFGNQIIVKRISKQTNKDYELYLAKAYICDHYKNCDFYYFPLMRGITNDIIPLTDPKQTNIEWKVTAPEDAYVIFTECKNPNFLCGGSSYLRYNGATPTAYYISLFLTFPIDVVEFVMSINQSVYAKGTLTQRVLTHVSKYTFKNKDYITLQIFNNELENVNYVGYLFLNR